MYKAINVANFFIIKANRDNVEVTTMQVLKMTYIANGWHLAKKGMPLIQEKTEAWKYGPVIPSVYHAFKTYRSNHINDTYLPTYEDVLELNSILKNKELVVFLNTIWLAYKEYSGGQLSTLTHLKNTPWDETWRKNGGSEKRGAEIPNAVIKRYYESKLKKQ